MKLNLRTVIIIESTHQIRKKISRSMLPPAADTQCIVDVSALRHLIPSPSPALVDADKQVREGLTTEERAPNYKLARNSGTASQSEKKLKILHFHGQIVVAPSLFEGPSLRLKLAYGHQPRNLKADKVRARKQHSGFAFL